MIKYYAFAKVVELGNISKAADALGYSQPGLSHILNAFENELGFPLMVRTKNSISPTENGKKILEYCHKLIDIETELKTAAETINYVMSGTISIGASNSMMVSFIPELLNKFYQLYPDIKIFIKEYTLIETQKELKNGTLDIAFLTEDISSSLKFYPLFEDKICLIMHKNHPLAKYEKVPIAALKNAELISQMKNWNDIARIVLDKLDYTLKPKIFSASDAASYAMVSKNMGVYIISHLQKDYLPPNIIVKEFEEDFSRTIGIAIKSLKEATTTQKVFIKLAQQELQF